MHLSLIFTISAPSPPTNLVAVSLNASAISITWSRPDQPNGQITRYEIQYNAVGSSDVTSDVLSANRIPGLKTLIGSLKPFTRYQFRIRAATGEMDVMWGNFSATAEATTGEAGAYLIYALTLMNVSLQFASSQFCREIFTLRIKLHSQSREDLSQAHVFNALSWIRNNIECLQYRPSH